MAYLTDFSFRAVRGLHHLVVLPCLALLLCAPLRAAQPHASLEQAVKASYLFKFAPFVEWPARALPANRPFTICVVGEDPFGAILDEVVRGQKISGHAVSVRRIGAAGGFESCQIAFAGRGQSGDANIFATVAGQPVLTVTDQTSGAQGAIIRFVMSGGRVRFQIDESAARANGLTISSKLLGLAIAVDRK